MYKSGQIDDGICCDKAHQELQMLHTAVKSQQFPVKMVANQHQTLVYTAWRVQVMLRGASGLPTGVELSHHYPQFFKS